MHKVFNLLLPNPQARIKEKGYGRPMTVSINYYYILKYEPKIEFRWCICPTEWSATSEPECSEKYVRVARPSPISDVWCQCPDMASKMKKFPHLNERMRVKELTPKRRIQLASWNICFFTSRLLELADIMIRIREETK